MGGDACFANGLKMGIDPLLRHGTARLDAVGIAPLRVEGVQLQAAFHGNGLLVGETVVTVVVPLGSLLQAGAVKAVVGHGAGSLNAGPGGGVGAQNVEDALRIGPGGEQAVIPSHLSDRAPPVLLPPVPQAQHQIAQPCGVRAAVYESQGQGAALPFLGQEELRGHTATIIGIIFVRLQEKLGQVRLLRPAGHQVAAQEGGGQQEDQQGQRRAPALPLEDAADAKLRFPGRAGQGGGKRGNGEGRSVHGASFLRRDTADRMVCP